VRDLGREAYAETGRPSIDPVVFFKLQLILFFAGLRSERRLRQVVADRLSLRWYLGYDLTEPLPDHSSLSRIRQRYGLTVFRQFFEVIGDQCFQTGLVWGHELYFDATKVEANASLDSVAPASPSRRTLMLSSQRQRHLRISTRERMTMARQCCRSRSPPKHRWR
jgi:transposase